MPADRHDLLRLRERETLERYRDFHAAYAADLAETGRERFRRDDPRVRDEFPRLAAVADSRRRAAEAALVLGDDDALRRVEMAGEAYEAAGLPYGTFLAVAAGAERPDVRDTARYLLSEGDRIGPRVLAEADVEGGLELGFVPYDDDALRSPVQRVYLAAALAATASEDTDDVPLARVLAMRTAERVAVPCGPSGMPLLMYAAATRSLASGTPLSFLETRSIRRLLDAADVAHRAAVRDASRRGDWTVTMRGAAAMDLDAFAFATFALRLGFGIDDAGGTLAAAVAIDYHSGGDERPG